MSDKALPGDVQAWAALLSAWALERPAIAGPATPTPATNALDRRAEALPECDCLQCRFDRHGPHHKILAQLFEREAPRCRRCQQSRCPEARNHRLLCEAPVAAPAEGWTA